MEFSANYEHTMRDFARQRNHIANANTADTQDLSGCPVEMHFKVTKNGGEVPIMAFYDASDLMTNMRTSQYGDNDYVEVVVPLTLDGGYKQCSGAEAILRYFTRRYGRLTKVVTPKGEVYYGGDGVVLDKNFDPIIYITKALNSELRDMATTIHVAPSVFIDDVSVVNKSILKKGIAFYLTHQIGAWGEQTQTNIVIDDGKSLFKKPRRPIPAENINREIARLLREDIADVLEQIKYDSYHV